MNTNSKRLKIYIIMLSIFTGIACALRTIACINDFNFSTGFFTDKALITAANVTICVTVILMLTYLFTTSKVKLRASFSTPATYIPTGMLAIATVFVAIGVMTHAADVSKYPLLSAKAFTTPVTLISWLIVIAALVSLAHYFFTTFITEGKTALRAYFSIGTIMFLALYAILLYLDDSLAINDQSKIINMMAYLSAAIFFLYESRISLGREKWRAYTAFGLVSAALCAYSSIPAIITYYVRGSLISTAIDSGSLTSIDEYVLTLALFTFIVARLILTASLPDNKSNPLITTIRNYSVEREKEIKESTKRHNEIFASKQLSVFDVFGGDIAVEEEAVEEEENVVEAVEEPEEKVVVISDEAIYESIFGKLPDEEKTEDGDTADDENEGSESTPPEKEPEELAAEILSKVAEIENEAKRNTNNDKANEQ